MEKYSILYRNFKDDIFKKDLKAKEITKLKNLGIENLHDIFYYFPRGYDDRTNILKIGDIRGEEYVVIKANLLSVTSKSTRYGKRMVQANATDGTGVIELIWFQMPYLTKVLKTGEEYIFIGKIKRGYLYQLINPEFKLAKSQRKLSEGEILPIYNSNKNLTQNILRNIISFLIKKYISYVQENIPDEILKQYKIIGRREALLKIHSPKNAKDIEESKRRFAIEELLILEMGIVQKRFESDYNDSGKYELEDNKSLVKKYLSTLKFELTRAQKRVITDVYKDLNCGRIINRLIQGDVGSGKTVVSMVLLLYMLENSYQGVLMAPTEILAVQHYLSIKDKFEKLGVKVALLTGSFTGKKKKKMLEEIANGEIDLVIGTHAVIQENVVFKKLGMIVIDEQHRFGVMQRKALRDKGILSNVLVMSATPIPRSLALTIYGDLDVSVIDELPPGRKPIRTKWISNELDLVKMYGFIEKQLSHGRQAYFVAPLIEESEKLAAKSVEELEAEVKRHLPNYRIGILHGKLKNKEKDEVMMKFKNMEYDVLVATTVIEVGVDVPNATIMVITSAQRFGLSALHQLRGRVGRGEFSSYCFLVSMTENATSQTRLKILEETQDGFRIAEEDLKLRKSGEIFGTKQSGLSDLKFVDIIHDIKTIKLVKTIAFEYLEKNEGKILNKYLKYDIERSIG